MQIALHICNAANTSLQKTTAKATSKNLRFSFLENHGVRQGLTEKFILAFCTTLAYIFSRSQFFKRQPHFRYFQQRDILALCGEYYLSRVLLFASYFP